MAAYALGEVMDFFLQVLKVLYLLMEVRRHAVWLPVTKLVLAGGTTPALQQIAKLLKISGGDGYIISFLMTFSGLN